MKNNTVQKRLNRVDAKLDDPRCTDKPLQDGERYYRSLIENSLDVITVLNADGTIRYVSPSISEITGFAPGEREGRSVFDLIHPDDLSNASSAFSGFLNKQNFNQHMELRIRHKSGSWRFLEAIGINLLDDPEVQGIVINSRDVTERRQAEDAKKRLEEQLQLAERLAAVGELAAGIAHELNNPLTAVQAFAQLLASRDDLDVTLKSDLETIYREAQRATKITGNMLSFARRHQPEKKLIFINEILEKSLELHDYRMKLSGVETLLDLAPDLPPTMADPHQMHQVFVNIILNAEHAMKEAHGRGKLCVKTESTNEMIRITFTDDGPGISGSNLKSIFDPFFTTKEVGEGTGLGLSICYGIVNSHGGRIHAESKAGKGANFIIEIPISSEDYGR